jgi:hypothetical protein
MTMSKLSNLSSGNLCYVPKLALNYTSVSTVIWWSLDSRVDDTLLMLYQAI